MPLVDTSFRSASVDPPAPEAIAVVSHCPLRAASFVWRAPSGRRALTVVCKATYELCPGLSPLAEDQDDILTDDVHWDGIAHNSLQAPSDIVPFKPRVDVLVTGHAYAPRGQTVRSLFARVVVGAVNKTIAVYGDRRFLPGGELSQPAELDRVPLCWERAAGGPGTSNPAGVTIDPYGAQSVEWAPNFQPPGVFVGSALDPFPPVGMGPLAPDWPERRQRLGPGAASWSRRSWYADPLPEGIDAAYFNSAPADQQVDRIAADERIVLENLHSEHARLVTQLDGVIPRATLRFPGQPDGSIELRCDTLWIDTDRGVCCITWRGTVAYEAAQGAEIHVTADGRLAAGPSAADTIWANPASGAMLPFSAPKSAEPAHSDNTGHASSSAADSTVWVDEIRLAAALRGPEPPFLAVAPQAPSPEPDAGETTLALAPQFHARETGTLPFAPAAPGAPAILSSSTEGREPPVSALDATATIVAHLAPTTPELPQGWSGVRPSGSPAVVAAPPAPPALLAPPAPPAPPLPMTPRPPLLGAAGLISGVSEPPTLAGKPAERALLAPILAPVGSSDKGLPEEPVPAVDPEAFGIERWAEITAEIDKTEMDKAGPTRADVLGERKVLAVDWAAVDGHWKAALEREAARGGFALRLEHDAAYVGTLERLRGRPVVAAEYAKVLAAGAHRQVAVVLREMEMPAAAHLPIVRRWTVKIARDPRLSLEMMQAVAALREGTAGQGPAAQTADRGA